ncbi:LysR family transcriptional regulator [Cupriavidus sp. USMAA2-4]|uniref:LysR family transcriptional regulator n=1 Tax=Cupriavidus sp. USMAA2-4 TaxID=876364 RepID=UPI0008A6DACC|nr:LysR substrate-binding domain-containing protein [Cupriavidus sp. USMAA2-4]AOY96367.1 LysR family transcriptional regulator [Cupriavidus sp. USMAA2-4]
MDLAELEIFRAVAREQSITRAAKRLERVQSNVTTRVKQLEESLGVALFQRDSKRMILTAEGHRLLGYAEQMLTLAEEARQSMRADAPSGTLRVGSMESSAATLLPRPLGRYHHAWPDVALEIATGTSRFLADAVLAHRLDCAVVAHPGTAVPSAIDVGELGEGLAGTYLCTEDLVLVLPADHPEVRRPEDVALRHLAAFARGCTYRLCAEAWLAEGGEDLRQRLAVREMPSYHAILASVAAGAAVAVVPRSLLDLQRHTAALQCVPVRPVHTFLVRREGFSTSAYEAFQRELLRT